jgi:hypothetical protein
MVDRNKARLVMDVNGSPVHGALRPRPGGSQNVTYIGAGVSFHSTIIENAEIVRIVATTDCHVRFGDVDHPTALVIDMLVRTGQPEYFVLRSAKFIAVVRDSADGILNIQIMD